MDRFGRTIDYLRVSVICRCNERCLYCMPEPNGRPVGNGDCLTANEILRVVRAAASLGFRKIRLTGGEPLMRPDLCDLIRQAAAVSGIEGIGLSTNGLRLASLAPSLAAAGLGDVNISLDTLDPVAYRRMTGGDLQRVLNGIRAAQAAGFARIKLNCVLMRGINEDQIEPLARFASARGLPIRFIELMPIATSKAPGRLRFLPAEEAMARLGPPDAWIPSPRSSGDWGPARYYRLPDRDASIGWIRPLTDPRFCDSCNRMRLTADGQLMPCLGDPTEFDLRLILRQSASEEPVRDCLSQAIAAKPRQHRFNRLGQPCRPMCTVGG